MHEMESMGTNNIAIKIEKIIWKLKKIEIYSDNLKNEKILDFKNEKDQLFSIVKNFDLYEKVSKCLFQSKYFKKIAYKKKISHFYYGKNSSR